MQCNDCGAVAENAPLGGEGAVLCETCARDGDDAVDERAQRASNDSGQATLADHGGNGQSTLFGLED